MQRTIKLVGLLFLFSFSLNAQSTLYPFYFHSSYKNGYKSSDNSAGIYYDFKKNENLFKVGYEYKDTKYENNSSYDNYQHDFILGYSRFISDKLLLDAAAHLTISDLDQADTNQAYLLGLTYVKQKRFSLGLDIDFAKFNENSFTDSLWQISPNLALWFGERDSMLGEVLFKVTYNYTNPGRENTDLSNRYNHAELSLKQFTTNFTNIFAFSFGKSLYLLKDKGFTFYNNNEVHTQGMILSSAYRIDPRSSIKLSYIYERYDAYDPLLSSSTKMEDAKMRRFVLSGSWKF